MTIKSNGKNKQMMIGAWVEPRPTFDDYAFAKEMGLTHLFVGDSCFVDVQRGTPSFEKLLKLCEETGLKAMIRTMNEYPFADVTDYTAFSAVDGINYWDEPFDTDFCKLEELADGHLEKYGDKLTFFVNLSPNETEAGWHPWSIEKTYREYVDEFCRKILMKFHSKILSCDVYPIVRVDGKRKIKDTWLPCLETIADAAKTYQADSCFFIQSASFSNGVNDYVYPRDEELRFQVFTAMAFGIRNFIYFTYADYGDEKNGEWFTKALVRNDVSCSPRPLYQGAKKLNRELAFLQSEYLAYQWLGIYPVYGKENKEAQNEHFIKLEHSLKTLPYVKTVYSGRDTLIGVFRNEEKNALFITNYTDPEYDLKDSIHIEFDGVKEIQIYENGESKTVELHSGVYEATLASGQGQFITFSK